MRKLATGDVEVEVDCTNTKVARCSLRNIVVAVSGVGLALLALLLYVAPMKPLARTWDEQVEKAAYVPCCHFYPDVRSGPSGPCGPALAICACDDSRWAIISVCKDDACTTCTKTHITY